MEPVNFQEDFNYKDFSELGNKWTYYDGQFKNDSKHGKGYIKLTNGGILCEIKMEDYVSLVMKNKD